MWQMSQVFHSYIHCRLDPVDATNYQCLSRRSCNELIRISWRWLAMYETVCHMLCKTILARCWARNSAKSRKNSCELCIAIRSVVVAKLLVIIIIIIISSPCWSEADSTIRRQRTQTTAVHSAGRSRSTDPHFVASDTTCVPKKWAP